MNYKLFKKFKSPTYLINVSRGNVQVEKDIIKAIDEGLLTGAFLDVFEQEPLPESSPLWSHKKSKNHTPRSKLDYPEESVKQVLNCYDRLTKGQPLLQEVSREKMY